ncbi:MAG: hypothetical protein HY862_21945 [Chloroflexi bacterium]|nr:hypothetical protein [Chloroflexota bacterium]
MTEEVLSLEQYLNMFPWTESQKSAGEIMEWLWHYEVKASIDQLWPHLCDTNRFNRDLGYDGLEFVEKAGILYGASGTDRLRWEWIEYPWDWVYGRYSIHLRTYTRGLLLHNRSGYYLQPLNDGQSTRVYGYIGSVFDNPLGRRYLKNYESRFESRFESVFRKIEQRLLGQPETQNVYEIRLLEMGENTQRQLEVIREKLLGLGIAAALIDRLMQYLFEADLIELQRIRIVPLVKTWEVPLEDLLKACLSGVRAGLLTISWDVICPHCRGVRFEAPTMTAIPTSVRCDACELDFDTSADHAVEVTFRIRPEIKEVPQAAYCSAEPNKKRHIKIQKNLPPSAQNEELELFLPAGNYRMRINGFGDLSGFEVRGEGFVNDVIEQTFNLATRQSGRVILNNPHPRPVIFVLEEARWPEDALRPAEVLKQAGFEDVLQGQPLTT